LFFNIKGEEMIITQGLRHRGEPADLVVLSDPFYVKRTLDFRNPEGDMPEVRQDFLRLIALFDQKSLLPMCRNCNEPAKLLAFYKGTLFFEPWCGTCIPHWMISQECRFDTFCDYMSALEYVDDFCHGEKFFYRMVIRNIAKAKGLPDKIGPREAVDFFAPEAVQTPETTRDLMPCERSR
jgi:hypothetical protein